MDCPSGEELALVGRAAAGDSAAFASLTEHYHPRLLRFCRRLMRDERAAQDLTQETLLRALQSIVRLENHARFAAWLFGIAANVARWWRRRDGRGALSLQALAGTSIYQEWEASFPVPATVPMPARPEELVEQAEETLHLHRAVNGLPAALRQVVHFYYVEGRQYAEIAAALDVPMSTVKSRLFESRGRLRRELLAQNGEITTQTTPAPPVSRSRRIRRRGATSMPASTDANKALVRRFYEEVVNQNNLTRVDELIGLHEAALIQQRVAAWRNALPDGHRVNEDLVAEDDKVVVRYTDTGTHHGAFFGVAPTGRRVTYGGTWVLRMAGGKIVEGWHHMDTLSLLQQLGATVQPPSTPDQITSAAGSLSPATGPQPRERASTSSPIDHSLPFALTGIGVFIGLTGVTRSRRKLRRRLSPPALL